MTALATQPPATAPGNGSATTLAKREPSRSRDLTPGVSNLMDSDRFEQLQRVATIMVHVAPKHLQGTHRDPVIAGKQTFANCFRVANQALRWGMDPFAVMDETYVVHGKLAYQGKLVAGVVNTRANLVGRLDFTYENEKGKTDDLAIVVFGKFEGEENSRTVRLSVGQAKTDNDMWRNDPYQKLIYSGVVRWARAHCPEIILGIVTDDDLERMRAAGTLTGNGDSMVHRSPLNETLVPEGDAGPDVSGIAPEPVPEPTSDGSSQTTAADDTGPTGGQLSEHGAILSAKMDATAGDLKQLTGVVLPEVVKAYGPKGSTADPEANWLFSKLDDLIVKASPKKKPGTLV